MTGPDPPRVSVIVNTLDRADHLEQSLLSLCGLDYPCFEVVVVNGPSTDRTAELLAAWRDRVKTVDCPVANLSVSRNVGIAAAAGDILAFIDDDAAPHPAWLARLAGRYADPAVGAVGGFTIDNTGIRWQVRKTLCDRYGAAYNVSDTFDERPFNFPGSPFFPSLLGTNSSFRATALRGIGGFDHAYAYMLDETDVCLRLVDAGWKVLYEPTALVFHQFAQSHIRSARRIPRTLLPSSVSKAYFICRHGLRRSATEAARRLEAFRQEISTANRWLQDHGDISPEHRFSLDQDLLEGLERGRALAFGKADAAPGDLDPATEPPPFHALATGEGLRVAIVSRALPPENDFGIARWSWMVACGLADRGHHVHVITRSAGEESVRYARGLWIHRVATEDDEGWDVAERYDIPLDMARWSARVSREIAFIKSFGLQLVSFPIWDLEGLPALDGDVPTVVSLHTTYAMAKPFKPEWTLRPLLERELVGRMIAAETAVLRRAPALLANSRAVMRQILDDYGLDVGERAVVVPHGTSDPLATPERREQAEARRRAVEAGERLRVLFVGRFEPRKGFDIALEAALIATRTGEASFAFAGDRFDEAARTRIAGAPAGALIADLGLLDRDALEAALIDSDIVLVPSRFESFGLVGIEAFAAGKPVFALAVGGLGEIVTDGVDGLLWPDGPDAAPGIATAIRRLAGDRVALLAMSRAARATFEARYTAEAMTTQIEAYYRAVLASAGSAR